MTPRHCIYLAAVLVLAAALRAPALGRGIDQGTPLLQWRETDIAAIARNFEREGMNILYPCIDWRGTGPATPATTRNLGLPAARWAETSTAAAGYRRSAPDTAALR